MSTFGVEESVDFAVSCSWLIIHAAWFKLSDKISGNSHFIWLPWFGSLEHARVDDKGADVGELDSGVWWLELLRQGLVQTGGGEFAGAVVGQPAGRGLARETGDGDDMAMLLL